MLVMVVDTVMPTQASTLAAYSCSGVMAWPLELATGSAWVEMGWVF